MCGRTSSLAKCLPAADNYLLFKLPTMRQAHTRTSIYVRTPPSLAHKPSTSTTTSTDAGASLSLLCLFSLAGLVPNSSNSSLSAFLSLPLGCCACACACALVPALGLSLSALFVSLHFADVPLVNLSARRQVCNSFFQTHFLIGIFAQHQI